MCLENGLVGVSGNDVGVGTSASCDDLLHLSAHVLYEWALHDLLLSEVS